MTPAHAIGAMIVAGDALAAEMDLIAEDLDDDDQDHSADARRDMIFRWKVALASYRDDQLDLFAGESA